MLMNEAENIEIIYKRKPFGKNLFAAIFTYALFIGLKGNRYKGIIMILSDEVGPRYRFL